MSSAKWLPLCLITFVQYMGYLPTVHKQDSVLKTLYGFILSSSAALLFHIFRPPPARPARSPRAIQCGG